MANMYFLSYGKNANFACCMIGQQFMDFVFRCSRTILQYMYTFYVFI